MTDPAAIAANLTEAQKRALRDPKGCIRSDFNALSAVAFDIYPKRFFVRSNFVMPPFRLTPFGRAVLAELDKEPK